MATKVEWVYAVVDDQAVVQQTFTGSEDGYAASLEWIRWWESRGGPGKMRLFSFEPMAEFVVPVEHKSAADDT